MKIKKQFYSANYINPNDISQICNKLKDEVNIECILKDDESELYDDSKELEYHNNLDETKENISIVTIETNSADSLKYIMDEFNIYTADEIHRHPSILKREMCTDIFRTVSMIAEKPDLDESVVNSYIEKESEGNEVIYRKDDETLIKICKELNVDIEYIVEHQTDVLRDPFDIYDKRDKISFLTI